jgi:hypothetical protein
MTTPETCDIDSAIRLKHLFKTITDTPWIRLSHSHVAAEVVQRTPDVTGWRNGHENKCRFCDRRAILLPEGAGRIHKSVTGLSTEVA